MPPATSLGSFANTLLTIISHFVKCKLFSLETRMSQSDSICNWVIFWNAYYLLGSHFSLTGKENISAHGYFPSKIFHNHQCPSDVPLNTPCDLGLRSWKTSHPSQPPYLNDRWVFLSLNWGFLDFGHSGKCITGLIHILMI